MNRYAYSSATEPIVHILPSQVWCKKSYPEECIVITSYLGNDIYECQVIDRNKISASIHLPNRNILSHYQLMTNRGIRYETVDTSHKKII
jgi:hypothetical protein